MLLSAGQPPFGLWSLVAKRPNGTLGATERQDRAARYVIGDAPQNGLIASETASELLAVRLYVISLLVKLARDGPSLHPREAMWQVLNAAYRNSAILASIKQWSRDRYCEDRGPPRIGATRCFQELAMVVRGRCLLKPPTIEQDFAVRDKQLSARGLEALISKRSPIIEYCSGPERVVRRLSDVTLTSNWPWWSYWLIDAPSFLTVEAFCHLRKARRTFAAINIVAAR